MVADTDRAYISGLFDADGSVSYKKYLCADKRYKDKKGKPKKYWQWKIALEISMTDKSVIQWVHEVLKVGTVNKKPPTGKSLGKKMQYRWEKESLPSLRVPSFEDSQNLHHASA